MREEYREHRERLLFETPPAMFAEVSGATRQDLADEFTQASPERQAEIVDLLAELTIDLGSYLTRWHLLAPQDGATLDTAVLQLEARSESRPAQPLGG